MRARQGALRAEVTIAARYPEHKPAPVSGVGTQEIYTLLGRAVAYEHGTRRVVGVSATGMTACPCAQELSPGARASACSPTGSPRIRSSASSPGCPSRRTTSVGSARCRSAASRSAIAEIDATALLQIVESSMSSEIYELMKRSDEVAVVEKAHARPRFVEDCVREMIAGVLARFPELDGASFVSARQENLETIHQHNVVAERHGLLSELRAEIDAGAPPGSHDARRVARRRRRRRLRRPPVSAGCACRSRRA